MIGSLTVIARLFRQSDRMLSANTPVCKESRICLWYSKFDDLAPLWKSRSFNIVCIRHVNYRSSFTGDKNVL